ncbi:MAG: LysM peptidoglycan-binding domain-containing protein [Gammaproteobacteria bacterium]|nr:LysM peptidoglycan-binding domain-containing protein [Gammaproteobacteria bacterium]
MEPIPVVQEPAIRLSPEPQTTFVAKQEEQQIYSSEPEKINEINEIIVTQKVKTPTVDDEYRSRIEHDENGITFIINDSVEALSIPVDEESDTRSLAEERDEYLTAVSGLKRTLIIHTIVEGDTLWSISKRYTDDPYKFSELAEQSQIKDPTRIYPGEQIRIIKYSQ